MKKLFLLFLFSGSISLEAQTIISGNVRDAATHEPLVFVRIFADSTAAAQTDTRGAFSFPVPEGTRSIEFCLMGYQPVFKFLSPSQKDSLPLHIVMTSASYALQAVTVTAERKALSTVTGLAGVAIEPKEIQKISGPFNDVMRSIQAVAGVASDNEMSSGLQVHGGLSDENLILINGGQVLEPFHLKEFPGSSITTINAGLLKQAEFYPGAFPARYGDRLSAVLDFQYREGDPDRRKGSVTALLSDGSVLIEGPISKNTTGLLNVHSTYSDYISNYVVQGGERSPRFYDVQGILGWDIAANQHLTLHLLQSHDETSGLSNGEYGSLAAGGTYKANLSDRTSVTATVSMYRQTDDLQQSVFVYRDIKNLRHSLNEAGISVHHWVSEKYDILAGLETNFYDYAGSQTFLFSTSSGDSLVPAAIDIHASKIGGYIENRIAVTRRLLLNLGARVDHSSLTSETVFSPRIVCSLRLDSITTLKTAGGLYYQTPTTTQLLAAARHGYAVPSMQKAFHALVGIERPLKNDLQMRFDLFYKQISQAISVTQHENGELESSGRNDAEMKISGADIELSFSDSRVMGWLNLSVLYANERNTLLGGDWHPSTTDQRRALSVVFEYRALAHVTLNLRAFYGGGFPLLTDTTKPSGYTFKHQPEYKRVDLGARYTLPLHKCSVSFLLDIQNVLDYRNVAMFMGNPGSNSSSDWYLLLPRVINAGVKFEF